MSRAPEVQARTEVRDGMRITWHQPIPMDDGIVLRADVFRPTEDGHYPMQREKMVRGKDYEYEGSYGTRGTGGMTHTPAAGGNPICCRRSFPARAVPRGSRRSKGGRDHGNADQTRRAQEGRGAQELG